MKKAVALILSILILGLSLLPCSDGHTCDESEAAVAMHDHSQDEGDHCSPFCVCVCCGSTFDLNPLASIAFVQSFGVFKYVFDYCFGYRLSYSPFIWHPPSV